MAQGKDGSATRPHSSPLMKFPTRPEAKPGCHTGRHKDPPPARKAFCGSAANHTMDANHAQACRRGKLMPPCQTYKYLQRMGGVIPRLVKQAVPDAPAHHHAHARQGTGCLPHVLERPGTTALHSRERQACRNLRAIPETKKARRLRGRSSPYQCTATGPELQCNRVNLRMNQHVVASKRTGAGL